MVKTNKKNQNLEDAIYVSWEESERDWGVRPDGFSLHLTEKDFWDFEKEYWSKMPREIPYEYSRVAGSPTKVKVSRSLYDKIKKTKNGKRFYLDVDEDSLVKNGELIFISERSGWVPEDYKK